MTTPQAPSGLPPESPDPAPWPMAARRPERSLSEELEDGPLKRELYGPLEPEPPAPPPAPPAQPEAVFRSRLVFDGTGSEYFRIWVVNVLLTLLTLGLYSAWAKVRKARWFAQHTALLGDRFDYHGDPWRILMGRVLALGLLALWSWSFDIALWLGFAALGLLLVAGPFLFANAQRFKLANTSWRGLRFGFHASWQEVYAVCVPLVLVWTLGTALSAADAPTNWELGATGLLALLVPWAHARLKGLQHARASFGGQPFAFKPAGMAFYILYGKGLVLASAAAVVIVLVGVVAVAGGQPLREPLSSTQNRTFMYLLVVSAGTTLVMWVVVWPFFAARAQQVVWGHTRLGDRIGFAGKMSGRRLWKLVAGQMILTLLTAGLYWPFAAVAIARYRIESVELVGDAPLPDMRIEAARATDARATGDAAADLFGLDLGW